MITLHAIGSPFVGANFVLCDGSVRLIPYTADEVMPQLATRNGNEMFQSPFE